MISASVDCLTVRADERPLTVLPGEARRRLESWVARFDFVGDDVVGVIRAVRRAGPKDHRAMPIVSRT